MAKAKKQNVVKSAPKSEAVQAEDTAKGLCLLVRKRITFSPKKGGLLKHIELGFFITEPLKSVKELFNALKEAEIPAMSQVSLKYEKDGIEVTMRRRKFRERDSKKMGRFEQLVRTVKDIDGFFELLRTKKYINDQFKLVTGLDEAKTDIATYKKRVEDGHKRRGK